jgi:hypothetical protein
VSPFIERVALGEMLAVSRLPPQFFASHLVETEYPRLFAVVISAASVFASATNLEWNVIGCDGSCC